MFELFHRTKQERVSHAGRVAPTKSFFFHDERKYFPMHLHRRSGNAAHLCHVLNHCMCLDKSRACVRNCVKTRSNPIFHCISGHPAQRKASTASRFWLQLRNGLVERRAWRGFGGSWSCCSAPWNSQRRLQRQRATMKVRVMNGPPQLHQAAWPPPPPETNAISSNRTLWH